MKIKKTNMKAEELMIGDWVMYNPNVFIDDSYETYKDWYPIKMSSGEDIDLAIEGCYSPIPLTEEILEKNGFKLDEEQGWWHWRRLGIEDGNEYIGIAFRDDDKAIYDLEILKNNNSCTLHCNYVHELQHALRLCGIDKEIEL